MSFAREFLSSRTVLYSCLRGAQTVSAIAASVMARVFLDSQISRGEGGGVSFPPLRQLFSSDFHSSSRRRVSSRADRLPRRRLSSLDLRWPLSFQKKSRAYASVRSRTYCHRSLVPRKSPDNRGFLPVNRGRTRTYRIILINAVSPAAAGETGGEGGGGRGGSGCGRVAGKTRKRLASAR